VHVDDIHKIHVEQAGNRDGVPALFLHGGPGSGCRAEQRRYFDPKRFRAVLFDQRGAGRSTPKRCLERNTTEHLVGDIERIREALGIERWILVGGSWGATLALAYAESHPQRVTGAALRAVYFGAREEFEWAFSGAARTFHPELWRAFVGLLPEGERGDPLAAYGARLMNPDPRVHVPAARVWHDYERALSQLRPASLALPASLEEAGRAEGPVPNTPFVEWHYMSHDCFLEPGQLLREAGRLDGIPGIIVQGRYDLLCPPGTADELAAAWGTCELRIVHGAGHAVGEPGILTGLIAAIDELGARLG
jgi:proline iminopeptidase